MSNTSHKIAGHYVIFAKIRLEKPLQISSGIDENSDKDLLLFYKNADDKGTPYIPASSFVGALKHYFDANYSNRLTQKVYNYIWGSTSEVTQEEASQSHFAPEDLFTFEENPKRTIRDGVQINDKGVAEKGAKYDYEILEPGVDFYFKAEIKIREGIDTLKVEKFISFLKTVLNNKELQLGANKNNGFGHFSSSNFEVYKFDFNQRKHSEYFFNYLKSLNDCKEIDLSYYNSKPKNKLLFDLPEVGIKKTASFKITADFKIKSSLIIGSDNIDAESDKVHLQSNGKNIISGKSVRGVVCKKIKEINEVWRHHDFKHHFNEDELNAFLGTSGNPNSSSKKRGIKSKLKIEECTIDNAVKAFEQTRIKIDRFTGGTMGGALLKTSPLQTSSKTDFSLELTITKPTKKEKYILLIVLKELWTGNLAIGGEKGIGRGVLRGVNATIINNDEIFELPKDFSEINKLFDEQPTQS